MSTVEILKAAREKIVKGWCQGAFALSAAGNHVTPSSRRAVEFCARGALDAVNGACAIGFLCQAIESNTITLWNDAKRRTKRQVLRAFNKAIRLAKEAYR